MNVKNMICCTLSALSLLSPQIARSQNKAERPNIIYVLADDMGYADLGCFGQKKIKTPNLDLMAMEGMIMTNHYAGTAVCAPSRCSLMSGLHTGHTDIRGNKAHQPEGQYPMSGSTITVAEQLKDAGYQTALIGKWGLGYPGSEGDPMKQGFDHFYGYNCQRQAHTHYPEYLWRDSSRFTIPENEDGKRQIHSHELLTKDALHFIKENKEKPFFLYLAYVVPHAELAAPEEYMKQYRDKFPEKAFKGGHYYKQDTPNAAYAAMISMMDADVGKIRKLLKDLGLAENTLVIFTSDNGPHFAGGNDADFFDSNGPLRGYKRDLYEGGIRSPFIAAWPGKIKTGTRSEHISAFCDFLPTACDLAGVETPESLDGISYLPTLLGAEQKEHDYLYWEFHEQGGKQAIRKGNWKAVRLSVSKNANSPIQLFNLSLDLGENENVATNYPEMVKEMDKLFQVSHTPVKAFPLKKTMSKN
jgi:arylsulfatase A